MEPSRLDDVRVDTQAMLTRAPSRHLRSPTRHQTRRAAQESRVAIAQAAMDPAIAEGSKRRRRRYRPTRCRTRTNTPSHSCLRAVGFVETGELERSKALFDEAIAQADRSGSRSLRGSARLHLGYVSLLQGDFESARAFAVSVGRVHHRHRPRISELMGEADLFQGDYTNAKVRFAKALAVSRERQLVGWEENAHAHLALLLWQRETSRQQVCSLDSTAGVYGADRDSDPPYPYLNSRSCIESGASVSTADRSSRSSNACMPTRAGPRSLRSRPFSWPRPIAMRATSTAQILQPAYALQMFRRFGMKAFLVESLELVGLLAADRESFTEAARLLASAEAGRRLLTYVRFPVDRRSYESDLARVTDALGDGFAFVWDEGLSMSLEEAADHTLRRRGERRRPSAGWAALTPAELKVAALVAGGLSNPGVAEKLFISRYTVETHLKNIYAKLGIPSSRAELAAEAVRRTSSLK